MISGEAAPLASVATLGATQAIHTSAATNGRIGQFAHFAGRVLLR
jgi:hypothetical protein